MDAARPMLVSCKFGALAAFVWMVAAGSAVQGPPVPLAGEDRTTSPVPVTLEDLYQRLKASEDAAEAKGVAALIARHLALSGSATADLLSDRARVAVMHDDVPLAIELMDRATALEPNWAEGWNRRATLFFRLSDPNSAIADLERALVAEPRHFEAWAGLGKVYLETDNKKRALDAFRRANALYPHWDVVKQAIEKLKPEVDGRDL